MTIAEAYGVGTPVSEMIMVARGEQGRVWRVDTDTGAFAIKELIIRQTPADAVADVAYQEAVLCDRRCADAATHPHRGRPSPC